MLHRRLHFQMSEWCNLLRCTSLLPAFASTHIHTNLVILARQVTFTMSQPHKHPTDFLRSRTFSQTTACLHLHRHGQQCSQLATLPDMDHHFPALDTLQQRSISSSRRPVPGGESLEVRKRRYRKCPVDEMTCCLRLCITGAHNRPLRHHQCQISTNNIRRHNTLVTSSDLLRTRQGHIWTRRGKSTARHRATDGGHAKNTIGTTAARRANPKTSVRATWLGRKEKGTGRLD